jgi:hypothetical protein
MKKTEGRKSRDTVPLRVVNEISQREIFLKSRVTTRNCYGISSAYKFWGFYTKTFLSICRKRFVCFKATGNMTCSDGGDNFAGAQVNRLANY